MAVAMPGVLAIGASALPRGAFADSWMTARLEKEANKNLAAQAMRKILLTLALKSRPMEEVTPLLELLIDALGEELYKGDPANTQIKKRDQSTEWTHESEVLAENASFFMSLATDVNVMNHVHLCMVTLGWAGVTAKPGGRLADGGGGGGGGGAGSSEISLDKDSIEMLAAGGRRQEQKQKEEDGQQVKETQLDKDLGLPSVKTLLEEVAVKIGAEGDAAAYLHLMQPKNAWALQAMGMGIAEGQKTRLGKVLEHCQDYVDTAIRSFLDSVCAYSRDESLGYTVETDAPKIRGMRADKRLGHKGEIMLVHFIHRLMGVHPTSGTQRAPLQCSFHDLAELLRRAMMLMQIKFPAHITDDVIAAEIAEMWRFEKRTMLHRARATQAYMDKIWSGKMMQWVQWLQIYYDSRQRTAFFPHWAPFNSGAGSALPAGTVAAHVDGYLKMRHVYSAVSKGDMMGGLGWQGISASGITKFNFTVFWAPSADGVALTSHMVTGMILTAGGGEAAPAPPDSDALTDVEDNDSDTGGGGASGSARSRRRRKAAKKAQALSTSTVDPKAHKAVLAAAAAEARRKQQAAARTTAAAAGGGAGRLGSHKLSDSDFQATMLHLRTATGAGGGKIYPLVAAPDSKRACTYDLISLCFPDKCRGCTKGASCDFQHWGEETAGGAGYGGDGDLEGVKAQMPEATAALA